MKQDAKSLDSEIESFEKDLKSLFTAIWEETQTELRKTQQKELENKFWHFKFDPDQSPAYNYYMFFQALEMYRKKCREWEEMHNGTCCVVERVRDTYLMPKIKQFIKDTEKS